MEVRKIETIDKGADDVIGNRVRVKVVKNKMAPPFKKTELEIMFGKGISVSAALIDAQSGCSFGCLKIGGFPGKNIQDYCDAQ